MKKILILFLLPLFIISCQKQGEKIVRIETSEGTVRIRLYDETPLHRDNFIKLAKEGYYNGILFHRVIEHFMIQAGDPDSKGARPEMRLGENDNGYTIKSEILPVFFHKKGVLAAAREGDNINPERNSSGSHFYIAQGKIYTPSQLDSLVEAINGKRHTALFSKFQHQREAEIIKLQASNDTIGLMKINEQLSEETRKHFDEEKLVLSEAQKKAYTTIGGIPHLDGAYTVYGEVIEGLEVVDKIAATPTNGTDRPLKDVVILKIEVE